MPALIAVGLAGLAGAAGILIGTQADHATELYMYPPGPAATPGISAGGVVLGVVATLATIKLLERW